MDWLVLFLKVICLFASLEFLRYLRAKWFRFIAWIPLPIVADGIAATPYAVGDFIGNECVIEQILGGEGRSGMGVVYLVFDHFREESYVLKTFQNRFLASPNARRAFLREALIWVGLGPHPYIVQAKWAQRIRERHYVLLEYVRPDENGRNCLADYLAGRSLPIAQALRWAIQFCFAMEHASLHGVACHGDIKPANILVAPNGNLKVTDFGMARTASSGMETPWMPEASGERSPGLSVTAVGDKLVAGTPGYMAPEVMQGEAADVRSDIYSFGLVLWQMASGSPLPPFLPEWHGDTERYFQEIYERHMRSAPPRVDTPLWPVVERCLQRAPAPRYPDFGALREDLEVLLLLQTGETFAPPAIPELTAWDWYGRAYSLYQLGRYPDAIVWCERLLDADPESTATWKPKGRARCYPRTATVWALKGSILRDSGRYREAVDCYDRALELDPDDAGRWVEKGHLLRILQRHGKALKCFKRALQIDPQYGEAFVQKGYALAGLKRHGEAVACCERALELSPRWADAWYGQGWILSGMGRHEPAAVCFSKALEIDPRFAKAWAAKGRATAHLGRYEEAIPCYEAALLIDPRLADVLIDKGLALTNLGRYDEAISCCKSALEMDPQLASAWYGRAVASEGLGQRTEAVQCYRTFCDLASEDDTQRVRRARNRIRKLRG